MYCCYIVCVEREKMWKKNNLSETTQSTDILNFKFRTEKVKKDGNNNNNKPTSSNQNMFIIGAVAVAVSIQRVNGRCYKFKRFYDI